MSASSISSEYRRQVPLASLKRAEVKKYSTNKYFLPFRYNKHILKRFINWIRRVLQTTYIDKN